MKVQSAAAAEPFTTKDGSTIRELHHTTVQSLAEATLEPGQATVRHYHRETEEIYLVTKGSGTMEVDGDTRQVRPGDDRGGGRRTRVWIEGIDDPVVASRTERTILQDMGQDATATSAVLDEALDLAERLANAVEEGRVDLVDLGRRARRVLEKTARPPEAEQLF
jgi:hypothetical protein